jgi:hypothetical protein
LIEKEYVEEVLRVMAKEKELLSLALEKIVEEDVVFSPINEDSTPGSSPVEDKHEECVKVVGLLQAVELKEAQGEQEVSVGLQVVEVKES